MVPAAFCEPLEVELDRPVTEQNQFQTLVIRADFAQIPQDYRLETPSIPGVEVEIEKPTWEKSGDQYQVRWVVKLLAHQPGTINIPAFHLRFRLGADLGQLEPVWSSAPKHYQVTEVPGFSQPPQLIEPQTPGFDPRLLAASLGAWAVFCTGGFFWFKGHQITPVAAPRSAVQIALERIDQLQPLVEQEAHKELHLQLSTTLRDFIQDQYQLPTRGQTTEEFLHFNRNSKALPPVALKALEAYFQLSDQIKFASFEPGMQFSKDALEQMKTFVESEIDPV